MEGMAVKSTNQNADDKPLSEYQLGLVAWDGVEPPTRGFSVRCSTN
jgi:hypothetical protein